MKKYKNSAFYISTIAICAAIIYWIVMLGSHLELGRAIQDNTSGKGQWEEFLSSMAHNLQHPLALLLAQIVTIIFVARLFGWICIKMKQPSVIGEMLAGIILGPSFIGMYFPNFFHTLFPTESLGNLQFLSQIGLILFMFIVGMELDLKKLKNKASDAVVISHASIIIPFSLGMIFSYFIYRQLAPPSIGFLSFALFIGISVSITAFPVLARIVQERGIQKTKLGTIVITCAAANDITAWCILAVVIAIVKAGSFVSALYVIGLAVGYVFLMIKVVRPFLKRIGDLHAEKKNLGKPIVAIFFLVLIISAYATEVIGIHALFGAFMAGAIMPENTKFRNLFIEKVEDVALVLLLPLFFVFTGLRTEIGLLKDPNLWLMTGGLILVAITGKFVGSSLAARFVGQNWKDSFTIGALMNTRGLMELIVLNIGYDLGILGPEIFAMMVIMALFTTFMTGPMLDLINFAFKKKSKSAILDEDEKYKILISIEEPKTELGLLNLANAFTVKNPENREITILNASPIDELHHYELDDFEKRMFEPILDEAKEKQIEVKTLFKLAADIDSEVINISNRGSYDLLLTPVNQSIYSGTLLGKMLGFTSRIINPQKLIKTVTRRQNIFENEIFDQHTSQLLQRTDSAVGIFIDKDFSEAKKILIPLFNEKDAFLLEYALRLSENNLSDICILDIAGITEKNENIQTIIEHLQENETSQIEVQSNRILDKEYLQQQDLMLIGIDSWQGLVDSKSLWLSSIPSTLILKPAKYKEASINVGELQLAL